MERDQLKHRLQENPSLLLSDLRKKYHVRYFVGTVIGVLLFASLIFMAAIAEEGPAKERFHLPKAAILATLVLLTGIIPLQNRKSAFEKERAFSLSINLALPIVAGFFFLGFQLVTAIELVQGAPLASFPALLPVFLLAMTIHAVLLFAGMVGLFYLWIRAFDAWNDPVKSLLYFSNRLELLRLEIAGLVWYTLSGLWILVFLVFLGIS